MNDKEKPELQNTTFLDACARREVEYTPIWIMRQAGRYLPSYQEVRSRVDFQTLCRTPDLVAEVSVQPVEQLGVDAAIVFSDILVLPEAMGMELTMVENRGPVFPAPVRSAADFDALHPATPSELQFVTDGIARTRKALAGRVPLIGFCGSPWTLFTYMVEGHTSRNFSVAKELMFREPELTHRILGTLADSAGAYLAAQVAAGADAVQIFDSWGGVLSPPAYREFSLAYLERTIRVFNQAAPLILFSKGAHHALSALSQSGADVVGVDWTHDLGSARRAVGEKVAVQGNMDPCTLFAPPEVIRTETRRILSEYGYAPGHIFNLGHGILPQTDPEHAKALVSFVHEESRQFHDANRNPASRTAGDGRRQ